MTSPTPNSYGVYRPDEEIVLSMPRPGWRGCPLASIAVVRLPDGWRSATTSCLPNGSGHAYPLTARKPVYPSRIAAVAAGAEELRRKMSGEGGAGCAILDWLDRIVAPAQRDLFS